MIALLWSYPEPHLPVPALYSPFDFQKRSNASKDVLIWTYFPHFSLMCAYIYIPQLVDFEEIIVHIVQLLWRCSWGGTWGRSICRWVLGSNIAFPYFPLSELNFFIHCLGCIVAYRTKQPCQSSLYTSWAQGMELQAACLSFTTYSRETQLYRELFGLLCFLQSISPRIKALGDFCSFT